MPCNCSGSHILGRLQKLSYLQKISAVSKSGLAAYNDHVQNTTDGADPFDSLPLYNSYPQEHWSAPSLRPSSSDLKTCMTSFPLQRGVLDHIHTHPSLPVKRMHTAATMQSSPAFIKTKQLFEEDRKFALEQVHATSPRIRAASTQHRRQQSHVSSHAAEQAQHRPQSSASSIVRTQSDSSTNSMADSVSSYHGYAGVNYQSGTKDIDAIPNQWGYSLNDYKAVFGDKYVHGCVPWEDEHISKADHKKFEKLHSRRVQLLQELHSIEQGIRELMQ